MFKLFETNPLTAAQVVDKELNDLQTKIEQLKSQAQAVSDNRVELENLLRPLAETHRRGAIGKSSEMVVVRPELLVENVGVTSKVRISVKAVIGGIKGVDVQELQELLKHYEQSSWVSDHSQEPLTHVPDISVHTFTFLAESSANASLKTEIKVYC